MSVAPLLADGPFVTDGGLETDLLFHHGFDLPEFAAFPLLEDRAGRAALDAYYDQYAAIARAAGQGLLLETPTWRANPDWAEKIGYDRGALDRANREAVNLVRRAQERAGVDRSLVVGIHGPRGDGYVAGAPADPDQAAEYHAVQARSFADEGVDLVHAMTMTTTEEATGVVLAARSAGLPVAVSFTVETDGRLPDGTPLRTAVERVDGLAAPDWFGINCAHPTHIAPAFDGGAWQERVGGIRPNASTLTHDELDVMEDLDEGDLELLIDSFNRLRSHL
ncbi:homocysteine S-methyltransferase family protein, partial [Nocardioides sp.]|uniref:homocysteine S-methyltransferase family protein n=1 Tax=Nocardioides sp. TaxID=35761 RepID=UPI00286DFB4E